MVWKKSYETQGHGHKPSTWMEGDANGNFICNRELIFDYERVAQCEVDICEGRSKLVGTGKIKLPITTGIIIDTSHAPNFSQNIISLSKLVQLFRIELRSSDDNSEGFEGAKLFEKSTGKLLLTSQLQNGMYPLLTPINTERAALRANSNADNSAKEWHEKLGHISPDRLQFVPFSCKIVPEMEINKLKDMRCASYMIAATKIARLKSSTSVSSQPLELIHTDIAGPVNPELRNKKTYMDVFLDDHSRLSTVYFLGKKTEFFQTLKAYQALAESELAFRAYPNAPGFRIFRARLDRAGEHTSLDVHSYAMQNGIVMYYSLICKPIEQSCREIDPRVMEDGQNSPTFN